MIPLSILDIAIIIAYLGIMLIIGLLMRARASKGMEDYFLGGRKIPWWIIGFSGMASNLDVTGTMVITSMFLLLGIKGYWVGFRGAVVLSLAFLMVFMGKWHRRSGVITTAEWMEFRFGSGKAGEVARLTNAIATIVMGIGMIAYFSVGVGFFLERCSCLFLDRCAH
jgi:Na+/proline symporter